LRIPAQETVEETGCGTSARKLDVVGARPALQSRLAFDGADARMAAMPVTCVWMASEEPFHRRPRRSPALWQWLEWAISSRPTGSVVAWR